MKFIVSVALDVTHQLGDASMIDEALAREVVERVFRPHVWMGWPGVVAVSLDAEAISARRVDPRSCAHEWQDKNGPVRPVNRRRHVCRHCGDERWL